MLVTFGSFVFFVKLINQSINLCRVRHYAYTWKRFVLLQTIQMGIVMYAPAVAIEAVVGLPLWISITATAAVAIIYTTLVLMHAMAVFSLPW